MADVTASRRSAAGAQQRVAAHKSQEAIDEAVVAQADDEAAWEKPARVSPRRSASVQLPGDLAARAAFFARLHRASSVSAWLRRVIQERTDLEEAAFASLKRELASRRAG
jgi:hypothetical protein